MSGPISPRLSAPSPPCLPYPPPPLPLIRANTAVYQVPELRTQIIRQLGRRDQATMMRVEKKGMALIARELYHTVLYGVAETRLQISAERHQVYNDAVVVIDARGLSLTPTMVQQLDLDDELLVPEDKTKDEFLKRWPKVYQPELLQVVIPPLRAAFRGLRKILFGSHYNPLTSTSWVVDMEPRVLTEGPKGEVASVALDPVVGSDRARDIGSGHISHLKTKAYRANKPPPHPAQINIRNPKPPSDQYTIHTRYDLHISVKDRDLPLAPSAVQRWALALTDESLFTGLYQAVRIECIPVPISTLKSLYQRQVDAGFADRLDTISAYDVLPFTIPDLRTFAQVAAATLTQLHLCAPWKSGGGAGNSPLSAVHVPQIVAIVREDLPNLLSLRFAMCEISEAESICRGYLTEETLQPRGKLHTLHILTDPCPTPLFNTLRCFSPMLRDHASVCILGSAKEGREFLSYLRKQPLHRRVHLSTIDFSTIGVRTLADVKDITYGRNGKPDHILVGKVDIWGKAATSAEQLARAIVIPELKSGLGELQEAARQLLPKYTTTHTVTTLATTPTGSTVSTTTVTTTTKTGSYGAIESEAHLLRQMQLQLDAIAKVEAAAAAMDDIRDRARKTGASVEKEMSAIEVTRAAREAAEAAEAAEAGDEIASDVADAGSYP